MGIESAVHHERGLPQRSFPMGMRSTIYPNTLGSRVYPGRGMLWRRWQPGQGYEGDGFIGFAGLGDELSDAESGIFTTQSNDPLTGSGETATEGGSLPSGAIDASS